MASQTPSPTAAPSLATARRTPLLTLRMHEIAAELQQHKAATPRAARARSPAPEALLQAVQFCRWFLTCTAGACCSLVRWGRCMRSMLGTLQLWGQGLLPCTQLLTPPPHHTPHPTAALPCPPPPQGPPALAAAEALCICLVYLLAVPNAVPTRSGRLHYTFPGSAEDVVALSLLRCVAVAAAHVLGGGPRFQRCPERGGGESVE